ncbi:MAG: AsmA family protein [Gammaproteobacteria bacterium]|nr:AsmA family protein [Gammaproteobacteria bacterium]
MQKLKLVLKLLAIVLVVIVLAFAALVFTFDPNNYKDTITAQVEKQTGRKFEIAGDISLSLFPWIGIEVENVSLANAEGFSEESFIRMSQLDVKVMLLPLLSKDLQVDKLRLHGLFASLEIDANGNNNWSDLLAQETEALDETKQPEQITEKAASSPAIAALAINGIELIDATVIWSDAQNNIQSRLSDFDLVTGAVRFNQPIDFQLTTQVNHNEPELEALVKLTSELTFNEAFTNILLDTFTLDVSVDAPELLQEQLKLAVLSDVNIDTEQQIASFSNTRISAMGAVLHASLDVSGLMSEPELGGNIHTDSINVRELLGRLGVELPPMAQDSSLTRLTYTSRLKANAKKLELDDIKLNLDDSEITGWLHLPDMVQPVVRYKLNMTAINLDAYLPPTPPDATNQAGVPAGGMPGVDDNAATMEPEPEIELPVEMLRKLDLEGELTMDAVTVEEIPLTDVLMKTQAKAGVVRIDPLQLNTLEGKATASIMANFKGDIPEYAIGLKASGIKPGPVVDPMLTGVFGEQDVTMDGAANVLADIKTRGTRVSGLKQAAQGTMQFDMGKTILEGVDFEYYVRNVVADYLVTKSLAVPAEWRGAFVPGTRTAFNRVHASATMANGDITNKDLILDSSKIKVSGQGVINIVRNDMDYNALVDVEPTSQQTTAEKLLDQPLAVRIHGPFEQLAYDVDKQRLKKALSDMLEAEARARLEKEIEEEKQKLRQKAEEEKEQYKEKLEDKLKDKLKGLF